MNIIKIKPFRKEHADEVSSLIRKCFETLYIGGHTQKGIEIQVEHNSPENLIKRAESIKYFVAIRGERVTGICGYDSQKVHTLFVDPEFQSRGIGRALLSKVLEKARNEGIRCLITWSTLYAEDFYSAFGFVKMREINFPQEKPDITMVEMKITL